MALTERDRTHVDRMFRALRPPLVQFARGRFAGVTAADADDVVADAFVRVVRAIADGRLDPSGWLDPGAAMASFLHVVVRHLLVSRGRRLQTRGVEEADGLDELACARLLPDAACAERGYSDRLAGFLAALDEAERQVFELRVSRRLTYRETKAELGVTTARVRTIERGLWPKVRRFLRFGLGLEVPAGLVP